MNKKILLAAAWLFLLAGIASLAIDKQVSVLMSSFRNPLLDIAMIAITNIGSMTTGLPLLVLLVLMFEKKRKKEIAWRMILVIIINIIVVFVIKLVVNRNRPDGGVTGFGTEKFLSSFPSGHAAFAFSLMSTLEYYYSKPLVFFTTALLVSFSRVYLQLHYLSDVLIGSSIGLVVYWYVVEEKVIDKTAKSLKIIK